jgi:signal peptidase I
MEDNNPLIPEQPTEQAGQHSETNWLREILETVIPAVLLAVVINLFLAQATRVFGQSMEPNLHTDQRIVVEKLSYRFHLPQRGDIVVLRLPQNTTELLIKRVVALPGETVEVHSGRVWVDGQPLDEPYLTQPTLGEMPALTVPDESVFVLGDNRGFSNDSRAFGPVPMELIMGHAWLSYWPPDKIGVVE